MKTKSLQIIWLLLYFFLAEKELQPFVLHTSVENHLQGCGEPTRHGRQVQYQDLAEDQTAAAAEGDGRGTAL